MISECKSTTEGAPALSACHVTMFFLVFFLGFGGEVMKTDTSRKINAWNQQITQLKKENHLPKLQCSAPAFNFEGTNIHPWNSQRCKPLESSCCALRKGLWNWYISLPKYDFWGEVSNFKRSKGSWSVKQKIFLGTLSNWTKSNVNQQMSSKASVDMLQHLLLGVSLTWPENDFQPIPPPIHPIQQPTARFSPPKWRSEHPPLPGRKVRKKWWAETSSSEKVRI